MRNLRDGFTLIELAVVLLIITVCITVVFPAFNGGFLNQQKQRSSVNKIAAIAQYAHQQAICAKATHVLHFDMEKGTYWLTQKTNAETKSSDADLLKGRLAEGLKFDGVDFQNKSLNSGDNVEVKFTPQGLFESATIYLASSKGRKFSIVMNQLSGSFETYLLSE